MCFLCSPALVMLRWVWRLGILLHIAGAAQRKALLLPLPLSTSLYSFLIYSAFLSLAPFVRWLIRLHRWLLMFQAKTAPLKRGTCRYNQLLLQNRKKPSLWIKLVFHHVLLQKWARRLAGMKIKQSWCWFLFIQHTLKILKTKCKRSSEENHTDVHFQ